MMADKTLKERYYDVCFSLKVKQRKLENIKTDTFIYNPEISQLIGEINDLEKEKAELEEQIND